GGVVRGSLVLIGGDPGIGKSTLLLDAARALAKARPPVLYVCAEESAAQVKMRADRLGIAGDGLLLWAETDLAAVQAALDDVKPQALIVDSIQTVFLPDLASAPGSVAPVRELAVLEKRAQLPIGNQDVFVNVAGGGRVVEPAADLAIVLAAASSYMERPLPADVVVLGEVGLTGEVRAVAGLEARLRAAAQLGFRSAVVPKSGAAEMRSVPLSVRGAATVSEALEALLP